ncbi:MAG: hypothetical protein AAFN92_11095 [Bacteroidota bacterium]
MQPPVLESLSEQQLELLFLLAEPLPAELVAQIRTQLSKYLFAQVSDEIDQVFAENNWGDEKIEEWKNAHYRTPYLPHAKAIELDVSKMSREDIAFALRESERQNREYQRKLTREKGLALQAAIELFLNQDSAQSYSLKDSS